MPISESVAANHPAFPMFPADPATASTAPGPSAPNGVEVEADFNLVKPHLDKLVAPKFSELGELKDKEAARTKILDAVKREVAAGRFAPGLAIMRTPQLPKDVSKKYDPMFETAANAAAKEFSRLIIEARSEDLLALSATIAALITSMEADVDKALLMFRDHAAASGSAMAPQRFAALKDRCHSDLSARVIAFKRKHLAKAAFDTFSHNERLSSAAADAVIATAAGAGAQDEKLVSLEKEVQSLKKDLSKLRNSPPGSATVKAPGGKPSGSATGKAPEGRGSNKGKGKPKKGKPAGQGNPGKPGGKPKSGNGKRGAARGTERHA